jgi:hypothetical protein
MCLGLYGESAETSPREYPSYVEAMMYGVLGADGFSPNGLKHECAVT